MRKEGFRALRMVMATMAHCRGRRSNGQTAHVELVAGAISELGGFINKLYRWRKSVNIFLISSLSCSYLIKGREDVIGKLDLCNGRVAYRSHADGKASNALLCKGCVEYSISSKLLSEARCGSKDATE